MLVAAGITMRPPLAPVLFAGSAPHACKRFGVLSWNALAPETVLLAADASVRDVVPPPETIVVSRYWFDALVGALGGASPASTLAALMPQPRSSKYPSFP